MRWGGVASRPLTQRQQFLWLVILGICLPGEGMVWLAGTAFAVSDQALLEALEYRRAKERPMTVGEQGYLLVHNQ